VDAVEQRGVLGARDVDDRVEGDYRLESAGIEGRIRHVNLDEGGGGDVAPGELQLPRRDVHAGDGEPPCEPARDGHARAAP
jgi:hypothetical protein